VTNTAVSAFTRGALFSNRKVVGLEEILGVEPLASRVAVTMHVPSLLARSECPLIEQPFAVPSLTRKLSDPPPESPFAVRVSVDPARPVDEVTDNTGVGGVTTGIVVVVVVVVGVLEGGGVGEGVEGGGEGVYPVPVSVTVCIPLPSFPSSSHVPVTAPSVVGENSTVSCIDVFGAMVSGGVVLANCVNGFVNALNPLVVGGVD
jgi:hypothetical protein